MPKDFALMEDSNRSVNPSIHAVSDPSRRTVLRGSLGASVGALLAPLGAVGLGGVAGCASGPSGLGAPSLGFKSVPVSTADAVVVPEGYEASVIAPWGEPVGLSGDLPAWKADASNTAAQQKRRWACTTTASTSSRWKVRRAASW